MAQPYHFKPRMYIEEKAVPLPELTNFLQTATEIPVSIMHTEAEEEEHEEAIYVAYILLLSIMVVYVVVGTCMEKKRCGFGHETGVVILLGIGIGGILDALGDKISTKFNPVILFDFGLPFILYAAGYNMRRRRFFDDINNITMFGILSTVVCFIVLSVTTIAVF